ncbi:MAG TPA: hypothetical protein VGS01_04110 [Candidatus Limnocylindria bacterium]|nr:hypothetical protein [Candidatus Limnocylindria bacterium]
MSVSSSRFALGEIADEVAMPAADDELRDDLRIDGGSAASDAARGLGELPHVGDTVLRDSARHRLQWGRGFDVARPGARRRFQAHAPAAGN